ncbi:hypothetical protein J6590_049881 [Homalodisca vitripennis]|nr:hypothetical protein J6590_049881 [Homalodisca vitripennis]
MFLSRHEQTGGRDSTVKYDDVRDVLPLHPSSTACRYPDIGILHDVQSLEMLLTVCLYIIYMSPNQICKKEELAPGDLQGRKGLWLGIRLEVRIDHLEMHEESCFTWNATGEFQIT